MFEQRTDAQINIKNEILGRCWGLNQTRLNKVLSYCLFEQNDNSKRTKGERSSIIYPVWCILYAKRRVYRIEL